MARNSALVAACTLPVHLGKIRENQEEILKQMKLLAAAGAQLVVFPELCLTGATLGDLFLQHDFLDCCTGMLRSIACETGNMTVVVGLPVSDGQGWAPKTPEEQAQLDAMPYYPAEGSVAMIGDTCVVKFSW